MLLFLNNTCLFYCLKIFYCITIKVRSEIFIIKTMRNIYEEQTQFFSYWWKDSRHDAQSEIT